MEFINEDSYTIIYKYNKLNQKINIDALEIKNLEKKKKGNQTVLDIQENIFYTIIEKKCKILKKYKFNIIKNAINYNKNKQIINLIYKLIKNNNNELLLLQNNKLIKNNLYNNNINIEKNKLILLDKLILLNKLINENNYDKLYNLFYNIIKKDYINHDNASTKKDIFQSYLNYKIQDINNLNYIIKKDIKYININFIIYLFINYKIIDINSDINILFLYIYNFHIYKYNLKNLHNSLKEYFKQKKSIEKLQTINIKLYKDLKKTFKKNDLIIKKSNQIIIKYKYNEKILTNQYIKYNKIKDDFHKNILDIDINILYLTENISIVNHKINKLEKILNNFNKIYGKNYNITDTCSICLNKLDYSIKTNCNHYFHYNCIILYICNILNNEININIICPICRQYI